MRRVKTEQWYLVGPDGPARGLVMQIAGSPSDIAPQYVEIVAVLCFNSEDAAEEYATENGLVGFTPALARD